MSAARISPPARGGLSTVLDGSDGRSSLTGAPDLVVIGAGVNGAAVAREATLRGLRTLLIDQRDLGAGTSASSSRMVHGGPRYLEHGELRLVRESLRERERLLRSAAHLVVPYPLLIPFYEHNRRRPAVLRAGMVAYDLLSFDKSTPRHRVLSRSEARRAYPGLSTSGLTGAALYVDAYAFLAERLVVEQALDVEAAGGAVLTHVSARRIAAAGRELELELHDQLLGRSDTVRARAVVNAAGPWVDQVLATVEGPSHPPLIGAVKGSHIVLGTFPGAPATGVHYEARSDGRAVLVLPQADGMVLVGSTEVVEDADPGSLRCDDAEIAYLLAELNELIPGAGVTADHVLHSYAGARPLPYDPRAATPAAVSRDHHVVAQRSTPGLFSLTGGKLTTHRALGELAVDRVLEYLRSVAAGARPVCRRQVRSSFPHAPGRRALGASPTRTLPLPGARTHDWSAFRRQMAERPTADLSAAVLRRLLSVYGVRAERVIALAGSDEYLAGIVPGTDDVLCAEVSLALAEEFARTLEDVLARRLMLVRDHDVGLGAAGAVADCCAAVAGWDGARVSREVSDYRGFAERLRPRVTEIKTETTTAGQGTPDVQSAGSVR